MVFLALIKDAYRDLNSKKLFWVVLALSGLVAASFFFIDITETGLKLLVWEFDAPINTEMVSREDFFKSLFVNLGLGFWLAWVATILALISTAGMIPAFVDGGAVDMVLSKPVSRPALFLMKYVSGLMFVALQVIAFTATAFVVLGLKASVWEPGLFLAVPLVVAFFSFLYCVCALLGVWTRSTIASLLLTLLFWLLIFALNTTDGIVIQLQAASDQRIQSTSRSVDREEFILQRLEQQPDDAPDIEARRASSRARLEEFREQLEDSRDSRRGVQRVADVVYGVKTVVPKTGETISLLDRWLVTYAGMGSEEATAEVEARERERARARALESMEADASAEAGAADRNPMDPGDDAEAVNRRVRDIYESRSAVWILGTSFLFEAVVLALATIIFSRRDY